MELLGDFPCVVRASCWSDEHRCNRFQIFISQILRSTLDPNRIRTICSCRLRILPTVLKCSLAGLSTNESRIFDHSGFINPLCLLSTILIPMLENELGLSFDHVFYVGHLMGARQAIETTHWKLAQFGVQSGICRVPKCWTFDYCTSVSRRLVSIFRSALGMVQ